VRSTVVVVGTPSLDCGRRIVEVDKPRLAEALVAELAIEALDAAVLHRPAGIDEVEVDADVTPRFLDSLGA
jgi:hypothetical protein